MPLTGDVIDRCIDLATQVLDEQTLATDIEFGSAQLECEALVEQVSIGDGMFVRQLGVTQIVLRFFKVDLGDDATGMRLIGTPFLAFRGDQGDICKVGRLAFLECQLPRLDPLPLEFHFALFQRGLRLLQLVRQLRADDGRKDLAFQYPFAGFSEKSDCAARRGIQRRADGSNDATLDGNVLNEVATCNGGYSDPVHRNAYARVGPPLHNGRHEPGTSDHRESNPPIIRCLRLGSRGAMRTSCADVS